MTESERQEPYNPPGMPEIHPPKEGPNRDPDALDPAGLVPGRPGPPPKDAADEIDSEQGA